MTSGSNSFRSLDGIGSNIHEATDYINKLQTL